MQVGSIIKNSFDEGDEYYYAYWYDDRYLVVHRVVVARVVGVVVAPVVVAGVVVPSNSAVSQECDKPPPYALIVGEMEIDGRQFWKMRYFRDWYGENIFDRDVIIEKGKWFKEV
jgi:hypothetical protein